MLFIFFIIAIASILYINSVGARWIPTQDMTWNIILGSKIDLDDDFPQIIEIDLERNYAYVDELHNRGVKVICYFSGGTIEKYRSDYEDYVAVEGLVKNKYSKWPNEWWLDYRVPGIKPLIEKRMKLAVDHKCDAIDIDNLDGHLDKENKKTWDDPLTEEDALTFTKWLADLAHSYGLSVGLKNCLTIINAVEDYYDFAINESCIHYNECYYYKDFLAKGKPVLGITYDSVEENTEAFCRNLDGVPISLIIKETNELSQKYTTFDGKKYCGEDFDRGIVSYSSPVEEDNQDSNSSNQDSNSSNQDSNSSNSNSDKTTSEENQNNDVESSQNANNTSSSVGDDNNLRDVRSNSLSEANNKNNNNTNENKKSHTGIYIGAGIAGFVACMGALLATFRNKLFKTKANSDMPGSASPDIANLIV